MHLYSTSLWGYNILVTSRIERRIPPQCCYPIESFKMSVNEEQWKNWDGISKRELIVIYSQSHNFKKSEAQRTFYLRLPWKPPFPSLCPASSSLSMCLSPCLFFPPDHSSLMPPTLPFPFTLSTLSQLLVFPPVSFSVSVSLSCAQLVLKNCSGTSWKVLNMTIYIMRLKHFQKYAYHFKRRWSDMIF